MKKFCVFLLSLSFFIFLASCNSNGPSNERTSDVAEFDPLLFLNHLEPVSYTHLLAGAGGRRRSRIDHPGPARDGHLREPLPDRRIPLFYERWRNRRRLLADLPHAAERRIRRGVINPLPLGTPYRNPHLFYGNRHMPEEVPHTGACLLYTSGILHGCGGSRGVSGI